MKPTRADAERAQIAARVRALPPSFAWLLAQRPTLDRLGRLEAIVAAAEGRRVTPRRPR